MIKVKRKYNYITREYFLSNRIICKTNRVTKWYDINNHTITACYWDYWDNPLEPTLGPTCLSAWSK